MTTQNVGIYLFNDMTMLDAFGPLQFLSFVDSFETFTFAKNKAPIPSDSGAVLSPDYSFADCPDIDILVVPGSGNPMNEMKDGQVIEFLQSAAAGSRYVTSVCTGSLLLAEAGLLEGYEVATHWAFRELLAAYPGVSVVDKRVAVDRNRISGGGVTAGIDFALTLIAEAASPLEAQALQLMFEYRPEPPFATGGPEAASPELLAFVGERVKEVTSGLEAFVTESAASKSG